eukprot:2119862-Pyramimonas_sp.AAC.1
MLLSMSRGAPSEKAPSTVHDTYSPVRLLPQALPCHMLTWCDEASGRTVVAAERETAANLESIL